MTAVSKHYSIAFPDLVNHGERNGRKALDKCAKLEKEVREIKGLSIKIMDLLASINDAGGVGGIKKFAYTEMQRGTLDKYVRSQDL